MISVKIKTNFTLEDLKPLIKKSIAQSTALVQWKANKNAPYLSWNLASSINVMNKDYTWIVWVDDKSAPYGLRREYENKKNPHKRFYMKRALESSQKQIQEFFAKNITKNITKKK